MIAAMTFDGFPAGAFTWFEGLARDNSRAYFDAQRDVYERDVRGALEAMLDELTAERGGEVRVFRQQRDVRFSPDKSPYKTRTYGVIRDGRPADMGLYAALSADGLYAGAGYPSLARDQLERFRTAVLDERHGPALEAAVATALAAGLELPEPELKTAPRGIDRDHPRIELLRRRMLIAGAGIDTGPDGIARDDALAHARRAWDAAAELKAWLEAHVGASTLPVESRGRGRR